MAEKIAVLSSLCSLLQNFLYSKFFLDIIKSSMKFDLRRKQYTLKPPLCINNIIKGTR